MATPNNFNEVICVSMMVVAAASVIFLILFWQISGRQQKRLKRELSEKYRSVYRVVSLHLDDQYVLKAEGAAIEPGDYGWEAEPINEDGLTYLHGLNDQWQVVWYAGFRKDQIELVGPKPRSQYYIFPDWVKHNIPPCPYPVKTYSNADKYLMTHFGFPQKIHGTWVQGRQIDKLAETA